MQVACLLEEMLSRLVGMDEYPRLRESLDYKHLIAPEWLAAPEHLGSPERRPRSAQALSSDLPTTCPQTQPVDREPRPQRLSSPTEVVLTALTI